MTVCVCACISRCRQQRRSLGETEGVEIRGRSLKLTGPVRVIQAWGLSVKGSLQSHRGESGVNRNLGRRRGCKHTRPSDLPDGPR